MRSLTRLLSDIDACRVCEAAIGFTPRPVLQFSEQARIIICGQAPGKRVHESGRPFTDPSGDRLRQWLGITPETFYDAQRVAVIPMGFCFPGYDDKGSDKPPRPECAPLWRRELLSHLHHPTLTILLGRHAMEWHGIGEKKQSLDAIVAAWRQHRPAFYALPHPSWRNSGWLKRHPWFEAQLLPQLQADVLIALQA